jgi:hypothetical protein
MTEIVRGPTPFEPPSTAPTRIDVWRGLAVPLVTTTDSFRLLMSSCMETPAGTAQGDSARGGR